VYEWATLEYMEMVLAHSDIDTHTHTHSPQPLSESYVLYMHTKGTSLTKYQLDRSIIATDRLHFYHFLLRHAYVCIEAMVLHHYSTCGVDKSRTHAIYTDKTPVSISTILYNGNFWWSTSEWLRTRVSAFRGETTVAVSGVDSSESESVSGVPSNASVSVSVANSSEYGGRATKGMAETYLLWGVSDEDSAKSHYCIHHNHHDG
jgi:hypothetical protein